MIHKTTRSILSVLLAALLLVTSTPLTPAFADGGAVSLQSESGESEGLKGDGTKSDPYQIATANDLREFAKLVNGTDGNSADPGAHAKLMNDIVLNEKIEVDENGAVTNQKDLSEWTPIGNEEHLYTGTFDGNGHTISGLYIDSSDNDYQGLFGYVSGIVQNLSVSGSVSGNNYVGGIVGFNLFGTVTNCAFSGSVSGSDHVGGVVGENSGSVINSYNTGAVSGGEGVGGVVGYNDSGSVTNCYNTGDVSGNNYVGGVVGQNFGPVKNCYNTGEVIGSSVGGVVGYNSSFGNVTGCYFLKDTAESGIGSDDSGDADPLTADEFKKQNSFTDWDFSIADTDTWTIHPVLGRPVLNENKEGGDGSPDSPYEISTATQLENFRDIVNGTNGQRQNKFAHAKLMENIDLSEICSEESDTSWTPIGNSIRNSYEGTFNGNGKTISGLYINDSTANYQGLFGCLDQGGTVQNLTVSGTVSGYWYVGGVVGYNNGGTVTGCIFSGSGSVSGKNYVGGVVGYNDGGTVTGCIFSGSGSVSGEWYVGGIAGRNNGTVENCYNTGQVNGSADSSDVGGVVGLNRGTVENCYNTDSVSGKNYVGGVVGYNISASVTNCYNTGSVSGPNSGSGNSVGGVVGYNISASVTNCYFLSSTADVNENLSGIGEGNGTASNVEAKTAKDFHSGEVAYLLQSKQADGSSQVWGQTLGGEEDSLPTLVALNPGAAQPVYKVTFKYGYDSVPENEISYTNGSVKFPTFERTGYTFAGWTPTGTTISQDTTFTAQWTANTYTVTLHTNDGTIAEGEKLTSYTYGVGAKLPAENKITKTGHTFAGWYNNADLTGDPVIEISATDTGEKEYWAKWTPNTYQVTLHTNDGTIAEGQNVTSYIYGVGAKLPTENEITKTGYIFVGWYNNADLTGDPVTEISKTDINDKAYWAKWEEVENPEPEPTPDPTPDPEPEEPPYTGKYSYEISTDASDNGAISVDRYATEGDEVTITVSPDDAYLLDDLSVTANGKDVELTANSDGTYTFTMPSADVRITATFAEDPDWTPDEPEEPSTDVSEIFIDIARDAWYKDAVQYAYDNGLMTGVSDTEFAPEATTTRAMIVSILARLEGVESAQAAGFADVDDEWYATAVNWAANVGVVNGYEDNTFRPNTAITREQLAAILMNYAAYKGEDVSNRADLTSYTDQPSTWAEEAMSWAVAEGLISGVTNTELQPQGNATRAQVAAILQRYLEA